MKPGPLRFLVMALGLWICARAAMLAPGWWAERERPPTSNIVEAHTIADPAPISVAAANPEPVENPRNPHSPTRRVPAAAPLPVVSAATFGPAAGATISVPIGKTSPPGGDDRLIPTRPTGRPDRWAVSAWLLVRRESGGSALAPGGTLGGSQAGARISYRLGGGLALSARASLPLRRTAGAEAAAGLDWRPVAAVPLNILAERRQALGRDGRSAFALTLYGGGGLALPRGLRLDAYGQAGMVGMKARNLFVDGAVRVFAPVGPVEVGVGARGAAQPGAARLDAGPGLAYRLPVRGANVRIEADWRFRVAGAAAPGSGPALTLATDF
ncbi:MAG TPA: hypothetical protein VMS43_01545 [Allosphingosinicella sp.]|nr:hypothetical protein [Allosphingosinicella sp.]